ncbi:hypothetical protein BC828DRAFT_80298 [Blastocladiella britannica]|nr:hypothetical protein BC828DRAFT_80298 [Blastocladiella britannica]
MVVVNGFSVCIEVDGAPAREYNVRTIENQWTNVLETTCEIASKSDAPFLAKVSLTPEAKEEAGRMHYQQQPPCYLAQLFVDGRSILISGSPLSERPSSFDFAVDNGMKRSLKFSAMRPAILLEGGAAHGPGLDDKLVVEGEGAAEVGTIKVRISTGQIIHRAHPVASTSQAKQVILKKKTVSDTRITHSTGYGDATGAYHSGSTQSLAEVTVHDFIFKYSDLGLMISRGIIADPNSNAAPLRPIKRDRSEMTAPLEAPARKRSRSGPVTLNGDDDEDDDDHDRSHSKTPPGRIVITLDSDEGD